MELMELLATRRTYRRFVQKAIPEAVINDIVDALRLSSCAMNRQAVRLLIVENPAVVAKTNPLVKWAGMLPPEIGTPKSDETPTLYVALLLDTTLSKSADVDLGIAIANMTLAAWAHGVGSCVLGAIDRPALGELYALPAHLQLRNMIAFGYPSHASTVVDMQADSTKYFVNDARDYFVPKRSTDVLAQKL